jgi:hypothetical protein
MSSHIIKTGTSTISGGETNVFFNSPFTQLPTVNCSPKKNDINIYVTNITLTGFTVLASVEDTFDIDYIAIQE